MQPLPTIGVRVHGGMTPRACIETASAAENNGFDSIWFAENPFNRGVLPAVAGAVLATQRITVGIGVFNPYNRHPTLIAMEIGALDELSGGRAALGIGSGIGDRVGKMGLSYAKPLGAVRDAVSIVRGMLRGDTVQHDGAVFQARGARLEFTPPRPQMPIYVAAMGDRALGLSGEIGDGLMISNMCPPGYTRQACTLMAAGALQAARAVPATVMQYVLCVARADRGAARDAAKAHIGKMVAEYWELSQVTPMIRDAMFRDSGIPEDEVAAIVARIRHGEDPVALLDDRFVDAYAIAGDADDCIAGARRFAEAGVTDLVITFVGEQPLDAMQLLGRALKAQA